MGQEREPITIEAAESDATERGILDGFVRMVTVRLDGQDDRHIEGDIHVPDTGAETHPPGSTTLKGQEAIKKSMDNAKERVRDSIAAQRQ